MEADRNWLRADESASNAYRELRDKGLSRDEAEKEAKRLEGEAITLRSLARKRVSEVEIAKSNLKFLEQQVAFLSAPPGSILSPLGTYCKEHAMDNISVLIKHQIESRSAQDLRLLAEAEERRLKLCLPILTSKASDVSDAAKQLCTTSSPESAVVIKREPEPEVPVPKPEPEVPKPKE